MPPAPPRLDERIAAMIREALASGRYAVGDRLPSERHLARHRRVSRPTVREAIGGHLGRVIAHLLEATETAGDPELGQPVGTTVQSHEKDRR